MVIVKIIVIGLILASSIFIVISGLYEKIPSHYDLHQEARFKPLIFIVIFLLIFTLLIKLPFSLPSSSVQNQQILVRIQHHQPGSTLP